MKRFALLLVLILLLTGLRRSTGAGKHRTQHHPARKNGACCNHAQHCTCHRAGDGACHGTSYGTSRAL